MALSQLCDPRVGAHLHLRDIELALSCRQLSYVGGRPHLSHILTLPDYLSTPICTEVMNYN